jgi:RNA polymerase sigma factor (sigma-70 family)
VKDEALIQRIKSGDTTALELLIQKYYEYVYSYCYRKIGNQDDAQDITQEVFLHFCRNFDNYVQRSKVKTYLYTIAHNLCINAMHVKKPLSLEDVETENYTYKNTMENQIETTDPVKLALNELPDEQKEVILLRFYHDFKLKEIAQVMSSGLSVTKYRLSQGLKTLGKLLSKEDWL